MQDRIYVNNTTGYIKSSANFKDKKENCKEVMFSNLIVTGDHKPQEGEDMVGGYLTKKNVYTKRKKTPDEIKRETILNNLKNIDASTESGSLKKIIEYLQLGMNK